MLTIKSILAVTKQQAAFGEAQTSPVPRDRSAKPKENLTRQDIRVNAE